MRTIVRPDREIDAVLNEAEESGERGKTQFPGKTYEEGILAAIQWMLGVSDDHPLAP